MDAPTAAVPLPASDVARAWLARLETLQELRQRLADAPDYHRWTIQARILGFLLKRYGADVTLDDRPLPTPPGEPWVSLLPEAGVLPRRGDLLRPFLQEIAQGNEELHLRRQEIVAREAEEQRARLRQHEASAQEALRRQIQKKEAESQPSGQSEAEKELVRLRREEYAWEIRVAQRRLKTLGYPPRPEDRLEAAWFAVDLAAGVSVPDWPPVPPEFVGLLLAGHAQDVSPDAIATMLDFHLGCGPEQARSWAGAIAANRPLAIAANLTTARWLASDLRGIGVRAQARGPQS